MTELQLDYQDYLRQHELRELPSGHAVLRRFKALRCAALPQFRKWVADERALSVTLREVPCFSSAELAANGALALLNLALYLLRRQIQAKTDFFLRNGGFAEQMSRKRREKF